MTIDAHALNVIVRGIHFAAMAVLVGGAAVVFVVLLQAIAANDNMESRAFAHLAATYEALFWLATGLLLMTGIGNLAAFGPNLPPASSPWSQKLLAKLVVVGLLVLASVPRTVVVAALGAGHHALPWSLAVSALRLAYGLTLGLGSAVLALAVWLARG